MNSRLKRDLKDFLNSYYKFERIKLDKINEFVMAGTIDVVDEVGDFWKSYNVAIMFDEENYPNVIPKVLELSSNIERDWDYHISKTGACCLDIPHKLIIMKRRGITLKEFYKEVIYPFFANHQYKMTKGVYANGEYEHHEKGIIQFYNKEFELSNYEVIIMHLKLALGKLKAEPNKECPICGKPKYKKCCKPTTNRLTIYGQKQLASDLKMFENQLKV